jgi:hypothetical protein
VALIIGKNAEKLLQIITILFLIITIGSVAYREEIFYKKTMNCTEKTNKKVTVLEEVYEGKDVK